MRPPSAAQSRAGAVAPAPRGFPVVACPDSIARDTRCLLLTHTSIMTSTSAQSVGRTAQSGLGRLTRSPVLLSWSKSVKRSLGNGPVTVEARSNRASTAAAEARGVRRSRKPTARTTKRRYSGLMSAPFSDGVGTATGRVHIAFEKTAQEYHATISVSNDEWLDTGYTPARTHTQQGDGHGLSHQPHSLEVAGSPQDGRVVRQGVRLSDRQRRDARVRRSLRALQERERRHQRQ